MFSEKITNLTKEAFKGRFSAFYSILSLYILLSFLIRLVFLIWSSNDVDFNFIYILRIFFTGLLYDFVSGSLFLFLYLFYLLIFPKKWIGSLFDKAFTYFYLAIILLVLYFSLLAEISFWEEFGARFNFIAVDYLIYTYEVVENINQSYPLPLLIAVLIGLVALTFFMMRKFKVFRNIFSDKVNFKKRSFFVIPVAIFTIVLGFLMKNKYADFSNNLVDNELGKNGAFSFVAAFRSNELDYEAFYPKISDKKAYSILKQNLLQENQAYTSAKFDDISRLTKSNEEQKPNIVVVTIESFSAEFLSAFGNKDHLTPNYDQLAKESIFFTNLYATGTRTVRGMEALTLCVPPTPGNSIVRRPNNQDLFSMATILKEKKYQPYFIYDGDGYFDNMNNFFGGQGFTIVDRDRGNPLSEKIKTERFQIKDDEVSFENAWGICDEDLYKQAIKYADKESNSNKPFLNLL
ncbi:LTA synthase family protein [Chryseobacterium schmidteae]|uniref:LTA synthase family protein n=1 Tax=Chryseobacterium schmidteae TaxID=2730404 RepID=UPI0021D2F354|nr:sulfatase-like hydrolase/transferase [Chryseobacterium schmidteae]